MNRPHTAFKWLIDGQNWVWLGKVVFIIIQIASLFVVIDSCGR